jgi:hypothetical protein
MSKRMKPSFMPLIMREKSYCAHEIRYITEQGAVKWMRVYAILLLDDQDQIIGTSGSLTDITDEVEAKRNIAFWPIISMTLYACIILTAPLPTYRPPLLRCSDMIEGKMSSINPYELIHPDDIGKVTIRHEQLLAEGITSMLTFRIKSKSGVYKWFETNYKLIKDSAGRLRAYHYLITYHRRAHAR